METNSRTIGFISVLTVVVFFVSFLGTILNVDVARRREIQKNSKKTGVCRYIYGYSNFEIVIFLACGYLNHSLEWNAIHIGKKKGFRKEI